MVANNPWSLPRHNDNKKISKLGVGGKGWRLLTHLIMVDDDDDDDDGDDDDDDDHDDHGR